MLAFTPDQWIIVALVFVLGLLVGGFLFSGGGRKWKHRYNAEVDRRRELESNHAAAEKQWREQDALRAAALKDAERNRAVAPTAAVEDRKPGLIDRLTGRDRDNNGIPERDEGFVNRDGDGVDDRHE